MPSADYFAKYPSNAMKLSHVSSDARSPGFPANFTADMRGAASLFNRRQ